MVLTSGWDLYYGLKQFGAQRRGQRRSTPSQSQEGSPVKALPSLSNFNFALLSRTERA